MHGESIEEKGEAHQDEKTSEKKQVKFENVDREEHDTGGR